MTKKRTQIELLEEISNKLSVVIDQLNNVLNYEPNVVELDTCLLYTSPSPRD